MELNLSNPIAGRNTKTVYRDKDNYLLKITQKQMF